MATPPRAGCRDLFPRRCAARHSLGRTIVAHALRRIFLLEHDPFGKPVPTFPDHALDWHYARKSDFHKYI
jgi:hypothetical protein